MSRKIIFGLVVVLFSIFALVNSAFADFDYIYTVGSDSSTTPKDTFDWDQQPWLYLNLPTSASTYSISWWNPDGTTLYYDTYELTSGDDEVWHTLDDWFDVGGPRQLGYWNIEALYSYAGGGKGEGSTNFTVTPEPVSSFLFLMGGLSLLGFGYRKRKKNS